MSCIVVLLGGGGGDMSNEKDSIVFFKADRAGLIKATDNEFNIREGQNATIFDVGQVGETDFSGNQLKVLADSFNRIDDKEIQEIKEQLTEILDAIKLVEGAEEENKSAVWMTAIEKLGPTGTALFDLWLKSKGIIK